VLQLVRESIGDPNIEVKIKNISPWQINHVVAAQYRKGRVFIAGDAAHRHPPTNGLGTNTSIQDSYNLAWKLALVLQGKAGEALLDTYSAERQPVGQQVVDRAIKSLNDMAPFAEALEVGPAQTREQGWASINGLFDDTEKGAARREALLRSLDVQEGQFNALGVELGQRYEAGAVISDGTAFPAYTRDPDLYYHPTTHPGAYLPHVWLERDRQRISTIDLAGRAPSRSSRESAGKTGWTPRRRLLRNWASPSRATASVFDKSTTTCWASGCVYARSKTTAACSYVPIASSLGGRPREFPGPQRR